MKRVFITDDIVDKICDLHDRRDREIDYGGITEWSVIVFGIKFDGGTETMPYYLHGPEDKITWFLLNL